MAHSVAAKRKHIMIEDRRYESTSRKRSKGDTANESDGTYDRQTQCMKLLETVEPPPPVE